MILILITYSKSVAQASRLRVPAPSRRGNLADPFIRRMGLAAGRRTNSQAGRLRYNVFGPRTLRLTPQD